MISKAPGTSPACLVKLSHSMPVGNGKSEFFVRCFVRFPLYVLASASSLLGAVSSGEAATLSATDLLKQFNLITKGDVTGSAGFHVDGRVLVGGDYKVELGSVVYMNGKGDASDFDEFVVKGRVDAQVHVNGGGNAAVGQGLDKLNMNGGGSKSAYAEGSAPSGHVQALSNYAGDLASMAASTTGIVRQGSVHDLTNTYNISGLLNGIGVLSLTEADIRADRDFVFNLGSDVDWVVVNVRATEADKTFRLGSTFKAQQGGSTASKVLWNFIGFEDVIFDAQFSAGAILADGSRVTTTAGNIEGSVFSDRFHGLSELHFTGLGDGPLPGDEVQQPAPVPLPAGMPLLLSGFGLLRYWAQRRKRPVYCPPKAL
ncbi:collagen-binding domain-containing protein [Paracoccus sp. SY]|uniref:collagen-binding domain-containing protein n=1 Tax=Paracoccus sp. SY TaxID=1330255 RepID=UPI0011AF286C|nr:collagen-binding domain-containing protein [Paracoccus sp. SY]